MEGWPWAGARLTCPAHPGTQFSGTDTQTEGHGTAGGRRAGARVRPHSPLRRPGPILFSCFLLHFTLIPLLR